MFLFPSFSFALFLSVSPSQLSSQLLSGLRAVSESLFQMVRGVESIARCALDPELILNNDERRQKPPLGEVEVSGQNHAVRCGPRHCHQDRCGYSGAGL